MAQKSCRISILGAIGSWAGLYPKQTEHRGGLEESRIPFQPFASCASPFSKKHHVLQNQHLQPRTGKQSPSCTSSWFWQFSLRGKSSLYSWINMLEKLAKRPHFWPNYHFDYIFEGVNIFYYPVYKPEFSTSPPPHHHTTPRKKSHHYTWINHKQNHLEEQGKFIFYHLCHLATHSTGSKTFADLTQRSTWASE